MHRKFVLSFLFVVAALAAVIPASSASASALPWMTRNGTIGALLKLGDGSQADLDAVVIGKIRAKGTHPYIVVHEMFSGRDKVVVMGAPSPRLRLGQTLDIKGILVSLPNKQRAIINATISGYCDKTGKLLMHGPLIKGLLQRTPWPYMTDLTMESKSTTPVEETSQEPNTTSLPGPTHFNSIHDLLTQVRLTADGDFIQMIEFVCKPIDSVGSGYFMMGEDDSQDQLKVYYTDTGTVNTSQRICRVVGQLRVEGTGQVLCVDSGTGYMQQDGEGSLTLAQSGTIGWAKTLPDGESVALGTTQTGKIVTCKMSSNTFYIEEYDRMSGIRVEKSSHGRLAGDRAYVVGTMATTADGERYINATTANHAGDGLLRPFAMINKQVCGGNFFYEASSGKGQKGVTGGFGINNIGLLVRTCGKVTAKDTATPCTWFTIDDGSAVGVKVALETSPGSVIPSDVLTNTYVSVTGISSFETSGTDLVRVVRPGPVMQPVFDPPTGFYCYCQAVSAKTAMLGEIIRYTISGNDPDSSSTVYDPAGVMVANLGVTLKARVYRDAWVTAGPVMSGYYYTDSNCGGGGGGQITWSEVTTPPTIANLRLTEIEPGKMKLKWTDNGLGSSFDVQRDSETPVQTPSAEYEDNFSHATGTAYHYKVRVSAYHGNPPGGATYDPSGFGSIKVAQWPAGDWKEITVVPQKQAASENQAVDSREDTRYVETKLVNFQFGSRVHRGGLFVGNADDPSKKSRSFLKFDLSGALSQLGTNDRLWTGGLEAYYTGSFAQGMSTNVGCQFVPNDNWNASTMAWNTAPAINPTKPNVWKSVTGETPCWYSWPNAFSDFAQEAYGGNHTLSLALASTNESNPGWAYFAKKEYDIDLAPHMLYAYGKYENGGAGAAPVFAAGIDLSSNEVTGGKTVIGTVRLNCPAPTGGFNVGVSHDSPCKVKFQSSTVHVPEGQMRADFVISTAIVSTEVNAKIYVTNADYISANLKINQ